MYHWPIFMPMLEVEQTHRLCIYFLFLCTLENAAHPNSPQAQRMLSGEPKTWQETFYKLYFRVNRLYKQTTYYTWRFAEIHVYKLILFLMVLTAVLKVNV